MRGSARIAAVIAAMLVGSITVAFGGVPVFPGTGGGGSSGVSSLNGQTGVVTAPLVEANATALAAQASAGLSDGSEAYVVTLRAMFVLQASTATAVPLVNVAASGKSGYQWVRQVVRNPIWEVQFTYSVDPSNTTTLASDENSCADDTHPCLTLAEVARRLKGALIQNGTSIVVRLLSNMLAGQGALFDARGIGTPAGTGSPYVANNFLNIVGVPTVVYTGIVASLSQVIVGAVGDNHFTDVSAPTFSQAGRIWKRINGTTPYFWPQKDLGSGVWRFSLPIRNGLTKTPIANGDTYQIQQLPQISNISFIATSDPNQYLIGLVQEVSTGGLPVNTVRWVDVQFSGSLTLAGDIRNCMDPIFGVGGTTGSTPPAIMGGLITSIPSSTANLAAGQVINLAPNGGSYISFQGVPLLLDFGTRVTESSLMFFDVASSLVELNGANASMTIGGAGASTAGGLGGTGNSSKIVDIQANGCSVVEMAIQPISNSITSDVTPFRIKTTSTTAPPNVDFTSSASSITLE